MTTSRYEYQRELVERIEADSFQKGNPVIILMAVAEDKDTLDLIIKVGDDKHRAIAETISDIKKSNNRYRKVTLNQKRAIAQFLVEKFGTARAALAAAAGVTEQEMFGGEEPAEEAAPQQPAVIATPAPRASTQPVAEFLGFSPLKGSEKQIAWAEKIRALLLKHASPEQIEALTQKKHQGDARWWINNRPMPHDIEDAYHLLIESLIKNA